MGENKRDSAWSAEIPLVGPAGEKIDLRRTILSNGLAFLPPNHIDEENLILEVTLPVDGSRPRTVHISSGTPGQAVVGILGRYPTQRIGQQVLARVRYMLRLDEDFSEFYAIAKKEPHLRWVTNGAGRMVRSSTVFEDVVKTICTTNCAWSATKRMVTALVEHLGEKAPTASRIGWRGRAFPTPQAMATAGERFYRQVAKAGYRGPYLLTLARSVAEGKADLEELARTPREKLPDEEVEKRLLSLPGVGPYSAAQIMMLLGRYSRLILDSWSRPTYAELTGRRVADATIERRFRPYGRYAGLAFWLFITRDWVT